MKKRVEFLKQIARDFVALGSIPFFILVLVRVWILDTPAYFSQFVIAGSLFLIITFVFKTNLYSGLALMMLFFTALVYNEIRYTIFGSVVYLGLLGSLFYLDYEKKKILLGILFGALSTGAGYYLVKIIFA